jgi:hypothetical protein
MNPRAFLELANRLFTGEQNPEGRRSVVSRAYYAAFNVAVEFLKSIGCPVPEDAQGHKKAYRYLNNCGDSFLVQAGTNLDLLRDRRNDADYKLHNNEIEKKANVQGYLNVAHQVVRRLDDCGASVTRKSSVATAVKAYKKTIGE